MNPPVVVQLRERTLANVLLDIAENERANRLVTEAFYAADRIGDGIEASRQSDIGADIDNVLSALRDEARAMVREATGVTWEQLYGADL